MFKSRLHFVLCILQRETSSDDSVIFFQGAFGEPILKTGVEHTKMEEMEQIMDGKIRDMKNELMNEFKTENQKLKHKIQEITND